MGNVTNRFCLIVILLLSFTVNSQALAQTVEKDMLLVFDASGSMKEQFGGVPRMDALKTAVGDLMDTLDTSILVGFRPLAHVKRDLQSEACTETVLTQNFTAERSIIKTQTALLQAVGSYTPLAYALTKSGGDFKVGNDNVLLLLTDGKDTCGGDPVKVAGELFNSTKKIKVYVIGMGVDAEAKKQLSLIASTGGGIYYDAGDSLSLSASLKAIENLERPKTRTTNLVALGGKAVAGGDDFGGAQLILGGEDYRLENSLAPGQYAYFKFPVGYYDRKFNGQPRNLKVSFTIFGDRMGVSYNSTSNSFEESNLHNYRLEFFDDKGFPTIAPVEIRDANTLKRSFVISGDDCAGGPKVYHCYFRIGSDDFVISKYDLIKIEPAVGEELSTSAPLDTVNDEPDKGNTTVIYTLITIIVLLVIIVGVVVFILLKKKKAPVATLSEAVNEFNLKK